MKKLIIIILVAAFSQMLQAQNASNFNLYSANTFLINPSMMGSNGNTNIFAHYRNQFSEFSGAPVSQVFTIDHKLTDRKFGLGLQVFNDKAGILSNNGIQVAYAYFIDLNSDWKLNFGLSASLSQKSIDFNSATLFEDEPSILQGNVSNTLFDGDFGMSIQNQNLRVGIAIPRLMQSDVSFEGMDKPEFLTYQNRRAYELFADYRFEVNDKWTIQPAAMTRMVSEGSFNFDIAAFAHYNNLIFGGFSYQSNYSASTTIGLKMLDGLSLIYNYSYPLNDIAKASNGGHEIALGYSFSPIANKKANKKTIEPQTNNEVNNLKDELFVQSKMNIRQREELERLKLIMKQNDVEASLANIKAESQKALMSPKPNSKFYVVLGAFSSLEGAQEYQKLILRTQANTRCAFVKSGDWILVYSESQTDAAAAKKAAQSVKQDNLAVEKPWIYVAQP